jgi:hypothetical protein
MPVPIGIMFIMRIKVIYATILFAVFETVIVMLSVQDSTAHFAHLGGLASGVILAAILLRNRADRQTQTTGSRPLDYMQIKKDDTINFSHLTKLVKTTEEKKYCSVSKRKTSCKYGTCGLSISSRRSPARCAINH